MNCVFLCIYVEREIVIIFVKFCSLYLHFSICMFLNYVVCVFISQFNTIIYYLIIHYVFIYEIDIVFI